MNSAAATTFNYEWDTLPPDGGEPLGPVILDAGGNLYGTCFAGGAYGWGTVFKVNTAGKETVLHSFADTPTDGAIPEGGLLMDNAGNLYGTTEIGGSFGPGTVFKLSKTGRERGFFSFNGLNGSYPYSSLIRDSSNNLYGTTFGGGAFESGSVFELSATGTETVLYSFTGASGVNPYSGVVRDSTGNLYGTTQYGGVYGFGTVFKLDVTGTETVLHIFTGGTDGSYPLAGLILGPEGNLYGTASDGGDLSACYGHGCGTVFVVKP